MLFSAKRYSYVWSVSELGKGIRQKFAGHIRLLVQVFFACITNGFAEGFATGSIYQGAFKRICVPGLNCYSCPGALGSCPLGSLQNSIAGRGKPFPFYVLGFLTVFGIVLGRAVCGFLCPFGLIQELLNKIPFPLKRKALPGDIYFRFVKYVILALFVVILPVFAVNAYGISAPWFCKYICPAGTLEGGLPLVLTDSGIRSSVGILFFIKLAILAAVLIFAVVVYRPFCRYFCPLGAIYGLFNKIALIRMTTDQGKCISCGKCEDACKMGVDPRTNPNSAECIRCGECIRKCPCKAISVERLYSRPSQQ